MNYTCENTTSTFAGLRISVGTSTKLTYITFRLAIPLPKSFLAISYNSIQAITRSSDINSAQVIQPASRVPKPGGRYAINHRCKNDEYKVRNEFAALRHSARDQRRRRGAVRQLGGEQMKLFTEH